MKRPIHIIEVRGRKRKNNLSIKYFYERFGEIKKRDIYYLRSERKREDKKTCLKYNVTAHKKERYKKKSMDNPQTLEEAHC